MHRQSVKVGTGPWRRRKRRRDGEHERNKNIKKHHKDNGEENIETGS
jgi:hypothetical protein